MQFIMNKKNLDRIYRRNVQLLKTTKSIIQPCFSTPITFRSHHQNNIHLLQSNEKTSESALIKSNGLLAFQTRSRLSNRFDELSKPKTWHGLNQKHKKYNFSVIKQGQLQFPQQNTNKRRSLKLSQEKNKQNSSNKLPCSLLNKTISFSINKKLNNNKQSLYPSYTHNSPLSLQYQKLQRQTLSLKRQINRTSSSYFLQSQKQRNTIQSNSLGKLSTGEILKLKQQQDQKLEIFLSTLKSGEIISNQLTGNNGGESQQHLREKGKQTVTMDNFFQIIKMQQIVDTNLTSTYHQLILDPKTIKKYKKLLNTLHDSDDKYNIQPYQEYEDNLLERNIFNRRRKAKNVRIMINTAEQWR